jgi:hypothetical protein
MARLYVVLFLAQIAFAAAALISCLSTEEGEINALPRVGWILIILFFPLIGSIAWFVAGRSTTRPRKTWRAAGGFQEKDRPRAPDDDPEFLRSLRTRLDEGPATPRGRDSLRDGGREAAPEPPPGEAGTTPRPDPDDDQLNR